MKRYLSQRNLVRLKNDFRFLVVAIKKSCGELDLRLRGSYFNLYYKGNSLAKVAFKKSGYEIAINKVFAERVFNEGRRFMDKRRSGDYDIFRISDPKRLHAFFQQKHLNKLCSNIKKVNYGEEIVFEQMLITDNRDRNDLIIIDRQITETRLKGKRLDLLALKRKRKGEYGLIVIEVKLGSNKELKGDVARQLQGYINHIQKEKTFNEWKNCYEQVYSQMKDLGLIKGVQQLKIIKDIKGMVLVGKYSGLGDENIKRLNVNNPDLEIKRLSNRL